MKKTILLVLSVLIIGCNSNLKEKTIDLADLNLILKTNEDIDSVMVTDIGQQREFHKVVFNDTIKIKFNDSINDLYNIWFFKNGKRVSSPMPSSQLWLNGENVIIKGSIDKKLIVDTILGSDLYYKAKKSQSEYRNLFISKADSSEINSFLLKNIHDNFDNPFSLTLVSNYILRNQNNKANLKKLHKLIKGQSDLVKNHGVFNVQSQLEERLKTDKLNFENYSFYNSDNKIVGLELQKEKKYLLDLWFVSCPPCVKDHKIMGTRADFFENNNIEIIGISTDYDFDEWKNYLNTNNHNWQNYREVDSLNTITEDLGILAFPTYILIENGGEIKASFNSFNDIENYVSEK